MVYNKNMITTSPLKKLLAEKSLTVTDLSQLTDIPLSEISAIDRGVLSSENLDTLCRILNCQPCDILEYTKSAKKGHWEWVANSDN